MWQATGRTYVCEYSALSEKMETWLTVSEFIVKGKRATQNHAHNTVDVNLVCDVCMKCTGMARALPVRPY